MSSKHNADNRSNQLNSNNDAYHSSRSGNSGRDDDDDNDGRYASSTGTRKGLSELFHVVSGKFKAFEKPPLRQEFTFDFVSLCGKVALIEMTAEVDQDFRGRDDCIDVAEHIFKKLRVAFLKECGSEIAFSQLRCKDGKIINWVGEEFNPNAFYSPKESAAKHLANRMLWQTTGKLAVQELKRQLTDDTHKPREDLGLINAKQLTGTKDNAA